MKMVEVDALEDCIERLQAGATLEQVLALYPQFAEELRPLLESARLAWSLRSNAPLPEGSIARSRVRFIEKASIQPRPRGVFNLGLHFSRSFVAIISAMVILAIATSFVSAQSLPGDILYPVKLAGEQTRLLLTSNLTQRLMLQESYDQTRADEVESVIQVHRQVDVTFVGLLTNASTAEWQVAGVKVTFPPALDSSFIQMVNAYVEVTGASQSDGTIKVSQIHLRELDFSGTITLMASQLWYINQVGVKINEDTVVNGMAAVGVYVSVRAYRSEDGTLNARQIDVIDSGKQEVQHPHSTNPTGGNPPESSGSENTATATDASSDFTRSATHTVASTATQPPEVHQQPTSTSSGSSSGTGGNGDGETENTSTHEPSSTHSGTSTYSPISAATRTQTPTQTATVTNTPTHNEEGGSGYKPTSTRTPTATPTPTPTHRYGGDSHN